MKTGLRTVILAGGGGTRLWPLSRTGMPKQFLPLLQQESLFQKTLKRLVPLSGKEIRVVAGERWEKIIQGQAEVAGIDPDGLFVPEPVPRNTAPAAALGIAALLGEGCGEDTPVLLCPSDHEILNEAAFFEAVSGGLEAAEKGYIVTFGIPPRTPETGFGYIKVGDNCGRWNRALSFTEKPHRSRAESFLREGNYLWNSGIFLFRIGDIVEAFCRYMPGVGSSIRRRSVREDYRNFSPLSLDYGIMEKTYNVAVIPLNAGWSDLGSLDALYDAGRKDTAGNVSVGDVFQKNCNGCLLRGNSRLIVAAGISDLLVVDTPDALFLSPRGDTAAMRDVVAGLGARKRSELDRPLEVSGPWGGIFLLHGSQREAVRKIRLFPGAGLPSGLLEPARGSLYVLEGKAVVTDTKGKKMELHRGGVFSLDGNRLEKLENPGESLLEIIEVIVYGDSG
ncbi:MAG: mannose-1-phosphate guanylyltransferase, partial [Aminobacteriaceae bacterium]